MTHPVGPTAILRTLEVNRSHVFAQYREPRQLSAAVATVRAFTGRQFATATERDLVTADIIGVRVTRLT